MRKAFAGTGATKVATRATSGALSTHALGMYLLRASFRMRMEFDSEHGAIAPLALPTHRSVPNRNAGEWCCFHGRVVQPSRGSMLANSCKDQMIVGYSFRVIGTHQLVPHSPFKENPIKGILRNQENEITRKMKMLRTLGR